ncbi:MAG: coproporphyrinogen III oxidase [Phycisphaerae bacterium]|jgi:oxygen-independent coproporphyrinogen-3 oxidase|nr:MAG: coproporphyrinogen III oxidase [Phycisphaerae bacterium]
MVRLDLMSPTVLLTPDQVTPTTVQGLYVHIPFCFHKCHYCDFYSITRQSRERMDTFVELLLTEASFWQHHRPRPRTVFFGGGTPSLLPLDLMQKLIDGLKKLLDLSGVIEWTVEVNPATSDREYLAMLLGHGVNRLSLGAQSFDPRELQMLERHHHPRDVEQSLRSAIDVGFERLNLDLIYAIPGQTLGSWKRSLEQAISLQTGHLSCYGLTYEPNTPMAVRRRIGEFQPVDESVELQMLRSTRDMLCAHGLPAYEISNYARPGDECLHNLIYWKADNYLGLGPSAASHLEGHRFKNRPHLREWEQGVMNQQLPVIEHERLTPEQRMNERVWLGLRLQEGVRFEDLIRYHVTSDPYDYYRSGLQKLSESGLIEVSNTGFCLTERGIPIADSVVAELLAR